MFKWRFTSRWKMIFSYVSKSRTTTRSRGITCCLLKIFFRTKKYNSMFARDIIYRNMFDKKRICFLNNLLLVLLQEIWTKNTFVINVSFLWYKLVMASAVQKKIIEELFVVLRQCAYVFHKNGIFTECQGSALYPQRWILLGYASVTDTQVINNWVQIQRKCNADDNWTVDYLF